MTFQDDGCDNLTETRQLFTVSYKSYWPLNLIVILHATSIRGNICLLYTYSLTDIQTVVILRHGENPSQIFTLAGLLFSMPTLKHHVYKTSEIIMDKKLNGIHKNLIPTKLTIISYSTNFITQ